MSLNQYKRAQDAYHVPLQPGPLQVPSSQTATLPFKFSVDPAVWGPGFWYMLHNRSRVYHDHPSKKVQNEMAAFITSIPIGVPCTVCEQDAREYISKQDLGSATKSVQASKQDLGSATKSVSDTVLYRFPQPCKPQKRTA